MKNSNFNLIKNCFGSNIDGSDTDEIYIYQIFKLIPSHPIFLINLLFPRHIYAHLIYLLETYAYICSCMPTLGGWRGLHSLMATASRWVLSKLGINSSTPFSRPTSSINILPSHLRKFKMGRADGGAIRSTGARRKVEERENWCQSRSTFAEDITTTSPPFTWRHQLGLPPSRVRFRFCRTQTDLILKIQTQTRIYI